MNYGLPIENELSLLRQERSAMAAVTFHEEKPYMLRVLLLTNDNNNGTITTANNASGSYSSWRSYTWSWHSASPAQTALVVDCESITRYTTVSSFGTTTTHGCLYQFLGLSHCIRHYSITRQQQQHQQQRQ
jgi:hypothetical protein